MVINVKNLVKRYGDLIALDHFNLEVQSGKFSVCWAPTGRAKPPPSTASCPCLNTIRARLKFSISRCLRMLPSQTRHRHRDAERRRFDELTVYENIDYFCGLYIADKQTRKRLVAEAIDFVGLNDFTKFYPKRLSGGLLRRLNIACGIAHQPKLIILDEPTVAVDPQSRNNILEGIQKLNRQGATIIYTSHYMEEVEQIASRIAIMDKGKIIAMGTNEELKKMIKSGEHINLELLQSRRSRSGRHQTLPHIISAELSDHQLVVKSGRGKNNLIAILDQLKDQSIAIGKILFEPTNPE